MATLNTPVTSYKYLCSHIDLRNYSSKSNAYSTRQKNWWVKLRYFRTFFSARLRYSTGLLVNKLLCNQTDCLYLDYDLMLVLTTILMLQTWLHSFVFPFVLSLCLCLCLCSRVNQVLSAIAWPIVQRRVKAEGPSGRRLLCRGNRRGETIFRRSQLFLYIYT